MSLTGFGPGLLVASHYRLPEGCVSQKVALVAAQRATAPEPSMVHNARTTQGSWRTVEQSGDRGMSKPSLISPGVAISVHLLRVPRAVPSNSSKPSGLRVGAACLKLFVVLGIAGKLWVDEVCS